MLLYVFRTFKLTKAFSQLLIPYMYVIYLYLLSGMIGDFCITIWLVIFVIRITFFRVKRNMTVLNHIYLSSAVNIAGVVL